MARIPYADLTTAPQPVREMYEKITVPLNIFKMMAHSTTGFRPLVRLGNSILGRQKLDAKLRELAILRVAQLSPARYEWTQHVPIAKAVGATAAQVEAIERNEPTAACFSPLEQLVLKFTTELVRDVRVSDATLAAAQQHFSSEEIVELILAVGYYMLIARFLETTGVDLEPDAGTRVIDAVRQDALKSK